MPISGLMYLVLLQLLGSALQQLLLPKLPAPIIGLLLLFIWLLWNGRVPKSLEGAASALLQYLPLLLVVPAVGLMTELPLLWQQLPTILVAILGALLITIPFCGWLMQYLVKRYRRGEQQ